MNDFIEQMNERASAAQSKLAAARRQGDDYATSIHLGELDTLSTVAREHGVDIPALREVEPEEIVPIDKSA